MQVQKLTAGEIRINARQGLCELLSDAVSGGASVGWVAPTLTAQSANGYQKTKI